MRYAFLLPVLLLAGCMPSEPAADSAAPSREAVEVAEALDGLAPGAPQRCLDQTRVRSLDAHPGTILFRAGRDEIYANTLRGQCSGLRFDDIPVIETLSSRYCSGDLVRTASRTGGMVTGACALGDFVPYTR